MIAQLEGKITYKDPKFIVLNTGGVGYKVFISPETLETLTKMGETVSLWTYLAVRENALDLYGFLTQEDMIFFEMLIGISGIGPKSAMTILSAAPIETLRAAVSSGDPSHLTSISGIGKKNAEKIVLELKGKLVFTSDEMTGIMKDESDVVEALKSLGYSQKEAREALKRIPKQIVGTSEKVKHALKVLGS